MLLIILTQSSSYFSKDICVKRVYICALDSFSRTKNSGTTSFLCMYSHSFELTSQGSSSLHRYKRKSLSSIPHSVIHSSQDMIQIIQEKQMSFSPGAANWGSLEMFKNKTTSSVTNIYILIVDTHEVTVYVKTFFLNIYKCKNLLPRASCDVELLYIRYDIRCTNII